MDLHPAVAGSASDLASTTHDNTAVALGDVVFTPTQGAQWLFGEPFVEHLDRWQSSAYSLPRVHLDGFLSCFLPTL
jgi:hypothetical protein